MVTKKDCNLVNLVFDSINTLSKTLKKDKILTTDYIKKISTILFKEVKKGLKKGDKLKVQKRKLYILKECTLHRHVDLYFLVNAQPYTENEFTNLVYEAADVLYEENQDYNLQNVVDWLVENKEFQYIGLNGNVKSISWGIKEIISTYFPPPC